MTLSVIGAGFGRTGTESMKLALETLGLGPCHHMKEVSASPEQTRLWRSIVPGNEANWGEAFAGYNSAVDWPSAYFSRELAERVFGSRLGDRDHVISIYESNTAEVQAAFGPDRLLTYNLGDGWEK